MKKIIIERIKKSLPYAIVFFGASIYFYFDNAFDLALYLFLAGALIIILYLITRKINA